MKHTVRALVLGLVIGAALTVALQIYTEYELAACKVNLHEVAEALQAF